MYIFADWKKCDHGEGAEPKVPKQVQNYALVWSAEDCAWAIWDCDGLENYNNLFGKVHFVSEQLTRMLDSTRAYPPALIMAVKELERDHPSTKPEVDEKFCELLRKYLKNQESDPFILIESVIDDEGYIGDGEFVWAIEYLPDNQEVRWISNEFKTFTNPISDFNVTEEQLNKLLQ